MADQTLRVDTKKAVKEINILIDAFVKFKTTLKGTGDESKASFRKIETAIIGLKKTSSSLMTQYIKLDKTFKNVTKSQKSFVTQTRNLKNELKATRTQLAAVNLQLDKMKAKKIGGMFAGLKANITSIIVAFGVMSGVQLFARTIQNAFELTKKLDSMSFAMKAVITQAVELAQTELWLKQITKDFGAELITTTNRYIKFRAAATQAGLSAKETQEIFGTMTKAAGVLGLRTDELTGIYLALEQMISKGKITTEELRRQLGERLPGAMDIMANSLKVTTSELDALMKKGLLITKDVLPGFAKQVEIAFGLKSIKRVDTLQAATVRLRNAWTILVEDFKKGNDASQKLTEIFDLLANNLGKVLKTGYDLIKMWVLYRIALKYTEINTWLLVKVNLLLSASFYKNIVAVLAWRASMLITTIATMTFIGTLRLLWTTLALHPLGVLIALVGGLMWAFRDLNEDILKTATALNKQSKDATATAQSNYELSASLKVLMERYKELNAIKNPTKEDKSELALTIEDIGKLMPGAVKDVDQFGRAISIAEGRTEEMIKDLDEMNRLTAKNEYKKQIKNLDKMNQSMDDLSNGLGVVVDGLGLIGIGADGTVKKIENVSNVGGTIVRRFKDLDDAQRLTYLKWKTNMKSQIVLSKEMIVSLLDIALAYDPLNMRLKLMREEMERIKDLVGKEPEAKTVEFYKKLIKAQEKILETEVLTRKEAIPHQKEILELQAKIDAILGKKLAKGGKRITQLRIVKDLLKDIENIQMKQQVLKLDIIGGDITKNIEDREDALFDSALTQIEIEKNLKDTIQKLNSDTFEKEKKKIEQELALSTTTVLKKIELEKFLISITEELRQKDLKAEENFANKIFVINNNLRKRLEGLAVTREKSILSALDHKSNLVIIKLQEEYEVERQFSENRITLAQEIFDASEKSNKDKRALQKVIAIETEVQDKLQIKLGKEKVKIIDDATRALIKQQILLREGDLIGLDADEDAEQIKQLTEKIAKLKVELGELDAIDPEITIDLKLIKTAEIIGHVKEITAEIGRMFDAFADARIEKIEAEIERERDRYDVLIDLAKNDIKEKEALQGERDDAIKKLEKKRLAEEQKQAKLRKAFALADIAQSTAMGIMRIWASSFDPTGISQGLLTAFIAALGAAQIATVLATPIPQYAEGSDGKIKKEHKGLINDAGVQEYVTRNGAILTSERENVVVNLRRGDEVHKDFDSLMKSAVLMNAFAGGTQIDEKSFNYFFKGISRSLEDGLSKAKFVNHIKFNNKTRNDNYGKSLSKWNN